MNNAQLRNTLPPEDQQAEFLLCAKFHDEIHDNDRGYVTTQWTPLHVLESIEDPYAGLAGCVKACILEGQAAFQRAFGQGPRAAAPEEETQRATEEETQPV